MYNVYVYMYLSIYKYYIYTYPWLPPMTYDYHRRSYHDAPVQLQNCDPLIKSDLITSAVPDSVSTACAGCTAATIHTRALLPVMASSRSQKAWSWAVYRYGSETNDCTHKYLLLASWCWLVHRNVHQSFAVPAITSAIWLLIVDKIFR